MSISLTCRCGKQLKVAHKHASRPLKCPACGAALLAPPSLATAADRQTIAAPSPASPDDGRSARRQAVAGETVRPLLDMRKIKQDTSPFEGMDLAGQLAEYRRIYDAVTLDRNYKEVLSDLLTVIRKSADAQRLQAEAARLQSLTTSFRLDLIGGALLWLILFFTLVLLALALLRDRLSISLGTAVIVGGPIAVVPTVLTIWPLRRIRSRRMPARAYAEFAQAKAASAEAQAAQARLTKAKAMVKRLGGEAAVANAAYLERIVELVERGYETKLNLPYGMPCCRSSSGVIRFLGAAKTFDCRCYACSESWTLRSFDPMSGSFDFESCHVGRCDRCGKDSAYYTNYYPTGSVSQAGECRAGCGQAHKEQRERGEDSGY